MKGPAVYGLIDPRDGYLRYIGCATSDVENRYRQHCFSGGVSPVTQWNTELRDLGLKPTLVILCQLVFDERVPNWARANCAALVEQELIEFYEARGFPKYALDEPDHNRPPLLNVTHTNKAREYLRTARERSKAQRQRRMEFMP